MPKKQNNEERIVLLMDHYLKGRDDMDSRRTRKNGWNECVKAYLNVLPDKWPYTSRVRDPRIRTAIIEKNGRLLNSKLQGRLVPREGGDMVKARINNAILDYQWDNAQVGGSMVEKVAMADLVTRVYGASFVFSYWDADKNCNEMKLIDPRDIFFDFSATHIKNAKWVQVREYTTIASLKERGFDVTDLKGSSQVRANDYESVIKSSRSLEDKTGDDMSNPTVEFVTEWTEDEEVNFLPDYQRILRIRKNPYDHKRIPVSMLRYYPLGDDIYGESEVEPVISITRAINAVLCGYIDQMNLTINPVYKGIQGAYKQETITFSPGAMWAVNRQDAIEVMQMGSEAIQAFNSTYSTLVNAFNTAMGDTSLGISNTSGKAFSAKTATEVRNVAQQQNSRDQYNQLYLGEFLKDVMMMWQANNKQYLFDDPSQTYKIIQIVGKRQIQELQQSGLSDMEIPSDAMQTIADTIDANPEGVTPEMLQGITKDLRLPTNPVVTSEDPMEIKPKLDLGERGGAKLYLEKEDLEGLYDYIPDVKSMAVGASEQMQEARKLAYEASNNPQTVAALQAQGKRLKMDEILVNLWEDAGYRDAESLIETINEQGSTNPTGAPIGGVMQQPNLQGGLGSIPGIEGQGQIPQPQQVQAQGNPNLAIQ